MACRDDIVALQRGESPPQFRIIDEFRTDTHGRLERLIAAQIFFAFSCDHQQVSLFAEIDVGQVGNIRHVLVELFVEAEAFARHCDIFFQAELLTHPTRTLRRRRPCVGRIRFDHRDRSGLAAAGEKTGRGRAHDPAPDDCNVISQRTVLTVR